MTPVRVLLAEDNRGDIYLVREALKMHQLVPEITVLANGDEAERYLDSLMGALPSCPDIFLLDLNLPRCDGHDLLKRFRENPVCAEIPVLVITSSDAPNDRTRAQALGANAYFRKPTDLEKFLELGAIVKKLLSEPAMRRAEADRH